MKKLWIGIIALFTLLLVTANTTFATETTTQYDKYIVVLENNNTYTELQFEAVYLDIDALKSLIDYHVAGNYFEADIFFKMLERGGVVLYVPFDIYDVVFVETHNGLSIYKQVD